MKRLLCVFVSLFFSLGQTVDADQSTGAKLVQANGCAGCHGAAFKGGVGPKLYGIEHRRTAAQIAGAIKRPKAPMPKFPLSDAQIADVVAYLSSLDGGGGLPSATLDPDRPTKTAVLTVRFSGTPPKGVTALPGMQMGNGVMATPLVTLHPTSDPRVWKGKVSFSMGGPWTIVISYDGKRLTLPVNVASSK